MKENIILLKTVDFSVGIKKYCEVLISKRETAIANQLLRCGMAIGANVAEAQNAESRPDFIHKMKIASKEASETLYWLSICEKMNNFGFQHELLNDLKQITAIISKIIISAKKNM
jgi:four helix bundle protein